MAKYWTQVAGAKRTAADNDVLDLGDYARAEIAKHAKSREIKYYNTKEGNRWRDYKRGKNKGLTIARLNRRTGEYDVVDENVEIVKENIRNDASLSASMKAKWIASIDLAVEQIEDGATYSTQGHYGYDAEGNEIHYMNRIDVASLLSRAQGNYQLKLIQNLGYTPEELVEELNSKYNLQGVDAVTVADLISGKNWGTIKDDTDSHWSAAGFILPNGKAIQFKWKYNHQDTNELVDLINSRV